MYVYESSMMTFARHMSFDILNGVDFQDIITLTSEIMVPEFHTAPLTLNGVVDPLNRGTHIY